MVRRNALQAQIEHRITNSGDDVFLTREFRDLGGARQVLRALRKLAGDGFGPVVRQLLDKLHVDWEPTAAERAYNEGHSTQVPMNAVVCVKGRFARRLGYRGQKLVVER